MCSLGLATTQDPNDALADLPHEPLEREITELAAHINAATCRWLELVGEFDRRESWAQWGCRSCTHWLSYRCGLSPAAARDQVRVARLLRGLPEIRATFGAGELCYSQVRAITRGATPEIEHELVEIARHATAAQLEIVMRAYRGVLEVELGASEPAHRRRYLRCEHDDDGSLLISARLPPEEGALVLAALRAGRDLLREPGNKKSSVDSGAGSEVADSEAEGSASAEATQIGDSRADHAGAGDSDWAGNEDWVPNEAQDDRNGISNADALLMMAQSLLSSAPPERSGADGYEVVVHVDAATLAGDGDGGDGDGGPSLQGGPALHPETARRLACDASLVRILERDGRPLSIGRRTRSVSPALRRAWRTRDETCRLPGCGQRRFLHAHHVDHWARGGRTDLSNLIHLCGFHHRLVHEGGYTVEKRTRGDALFRHPDGSALQNLPARPPGDRRELRRRHHQAGLHLDHDTSPPRVSHDRFDRNWVVDGLGEADPRLRE